MAAANRLAEFREKAGLSQEVLGERLNSGRSTVVKLERGERKLTIDWLVRIASVLECDPWDILPEQKTPEQEEMEMQLRFRAMNQVQKDTLLGVARQIKPKID